MTPHIELDRDGLAALREDTRLRCRKSDQPRRLVLDDAGEPLRVTLPAPSVLASLIEVRGCHVYRQGAAVLLQEGESDPLVPLDLRGLAGLLRSALQTLPEPAGGLHLPLPALHHAVRIPSGGADAYLLDVVRAYRETLPGPPAATRRSDSARGSAMTPAERQRASRDRRYRAERASARWWLGLFLYDEDTPPTLGDHAVATLYSRACEVLREYAEDGEVLDDGTAVRVPRRAAFVAELEARLGPQRRTRRGQVVAVTAEALIGERAASALLADLEAELERAARTG